MLGIETNNNNNDDFDYRMDIIKDNITSSQTYYEQYFEEKETYNIYKYRNNYLSYHSTAYNNILRIIKNIDFTNWEYFHEFKAKMLSVVDFTGQFLQFKSLIYNDQLFKLLCENVGAYNEDDINKLVLSLFIDVFIDIKYWIFSAAPSFYQMLHITSIYKTWSLYVIRYKNEDDEIECIKVGISDRIKDRLNEHRGNINKLKDLINQLHSYPSNKDFIGSISIRSPIKKLTATVDVYEGVCYAKFIEDKLIECIAPNKKQTHIPVINKMKETCFNNIQTLESTINNKINEIRLQLSYNTNF